MRVHIRRSFGSTSSFPAWKPLDYFHHEVLHASTKPGSRARVGRLHTPHGTVETPGFVVVGTNAPTVSPTKSPTKAPTTSPTPAPTPLTPDTHSPTPSSLTEVVVSTTVRLAGCGEQAFSSADAQSVRQAAARVITAVASEADVCDVTVSAAHGTASFDPPVAPPTDPNGGRRLSEAIDVTFEVTAVLETSGFTSAAALFQSIQAR